MTRVRLVEIADITMGQSPPGETYNTEGIGLPLFQGKAEFGEEHPTAVKWCSAPRRTAEPGDILLSVRAPVGPTNVAAQKCCIGRGLAAIRARDNKAMTRYLLYFFRKFEKEISERGVGSTFAAINKTDIEDLELPLPPLSEQERIVKILDAADELRKLRQQADRRTADLIPAIFHDMFGDPATNPKGWLVTSLGSVCALVNGRAFKPSDWEKEGLPIIRIQNLNDPDKPFNYYSGDLPDKFRVRSGDILLSWSGTPGTSFGCFRWQGPEGWLNQHIFKVHLDDQLEGDFFIEHVNGKLSELISKAHGGVGLQHVTKGMLESTVLMVPPIALQREFAARVAQVRQMEEQQAESGRCMDDLFQSLLHRAFEGEL